MSDDEPTTAESRIQPELDAEATGTGIVLGNDELILTNNHVIGDSTAIKVTVAATGTTCTAEGSADSESLNTLNTMIEVDADIVSSEQMQTNTLDYPACADRTAQSPLCGAICRGGNVAARLERLATRLRIELRCLDCEGGGIASAGTAVPECRDGGGQPARADK